MENGTTQCGLRQKKVRAPLRHFYFGRSKKAPKKFTTIFTSLIDGTSECIHIKVTKEKNDFLCLKQNFPFRRLHSEEKIICHCERQKKRAGKNRNFPLLIFSRRFHRNHVNEAKALSALSAQRKTHLLVKLLDFRREIFAKKLETINKKRCEVSCNLI